MALESFTETYGVSRSPSRRARSRQKAGLRLPPVPCSKYHIIGEPFLRKRRGNTKAGSQWRPMPKHSTRLWTERFIDKRTIYGKGQEHLYRLLSREQTHLPTIEESPRFSEQVVDQQALREKSLAVKEYSPTGSFSHFRRNNAVIPTVYSDYFKSYAREKSYVNRKYAEYRNFDKKDSRNHGNENTRQEAEMMYYKCLSCAPLCEVVGSRYCAHCLELENRQFARKYETEHFQAD